ncbi:hypothetical protein CY34DRAFT_76810 [Suillus luteus UH-Slu-Lm8-n1]|uniref:Anaphase-promoting complex subunit 5 n=1 Tax=Suillus luteus UH-Slu-Lm8-n1 TaxID=930992 RepID=A0A0D0BSS1_9AGAM|nr:hypothetical protein CY34DRAFT_76810 [Suillus luteus UH-Slu-Lm8-n1]
MTNESSSDSDLKNAIQHFRFVLDQCPVGHLDRVAALTNLARARLQDHICNDVQDINSTIFLFRDALALRPKGHSDHTSDHYLDNLACSLKSRFNHQSKSGDLNEAFALFHQVLRLRFVGHKCRDISSNNLAGALQSRFKQRNEIKDINKTINLFRMALALCLTRHPRRYAVLNNLAVALDTRYQELQTSEDLDEAIDRYRESLRLTQHSH